VRFVLNGRDVVPDAGSADPAGDNRVHPMARLLDVVRERFGLTGTKEGCGEGECGACTLLVDGRPVNACLVPVAHVDGCEVVTIEGLTGCEALQHGFATEGGAQCGICTPGMIVAASVIPIDATLDDTREALAGNLCRCTGYEGIYRAIHAARSRPASAATTAQADRGGDAPAARGRGAV
jgi:aerobic-type carbon monoxide dehydrogenase small subunit (CoxS/CutS family)